MPHQWEMTWVVHSNKSISLIFCECLGTKKVSSHVTYMASHRWQQKVWIWPLTVKEMSILVQEEMCFSLGWGHFPFELPLGCGCWGSPLCQQAEEGSSEWAPGSTWNISVSTKKIIFCNANGTPLEDKVAVSESQAGCFAYGAASPACLSSARFTSTPVLWVQPGMPEMDVYILMDSAILLPCYCPSADAGVFPQLIAGVESRSLSIFTLQNEEINPLQTM